MTPAKRTSLIIESLPEELKKELTKEMAYWAPEVTLAYLNAFVNSHIPKSADNPISVRVYAAVCGLSEEKMKARLILDGYF